MERHTVPEESLVDPPLEWRDCPIKSTNNHQVINSDHIMITVLVSSSVWKPLAKRVKERKNKKKKQVEAAFCKVCYAHS